MRNLFALTIFLCVISVIYCGLIGRRQRVIIKGKLLCGTKPASDILLKLIDEDDGGIDDVMFEKRTDQNGEFHLDGEASEITNIDPVLKIYHDCNDNLPCQRKWKMKIPDNHINTNKAVDIGIWNLETILSGESRDCFH